MKRPEGFGASRGAATPAGKAPSAPHALKKPGSSKPASAKPASSKPASSKPTSAKRTSAKPARAKNTPVPVEPDAVRAAARELRHPASARRRYERGEVKRFTRRSRQRRLTWLIAGGAVVVMIIVVTCAVFSPILSLKTVTIEGVSRLSASDVQHAVRGQLGKPLAMVDFGAIKKDLSTFPLIRSYVTETVPPNTIVIRITERAPIGAIATATGYSVVDPAGIVIEKTTDRPAHLAVIDIGAATTDSAAFTAAVSVLLALPTDVLSKVDSVTAQTKNDVSFTLMNSTQTVVWGSADQSALKARVLVALIQTQKASASVKYDVSAPTNPVVGPA